MRVFAVLFKEAPLDGRERYGPHYQPLLRGHPPARLRQRRQGFDGLRLEHLAWGQIQSLGLGPADHLQADNRVPAQFEEVVPPPDPLHPQQSRPDLRQGLLHRRLRRGIFRRPGQDRPLWLGQRFPVDLTVGGLRQIIQHHKRRGHHIIWQPRLQLLAQAPQDSLGLETRLQGQVAHQARRPLLGSAHHDHRLGYPRAGGEFALDLAQLNAVAVQLDLEIHAPQKFNIPVRQVAYLVTGLVQPPRAIGIGDEPLLSQLRAVQVAAPHLGPADIQFTRHPDGRRLELCVQHVHLGVGHRTPNRQCVALGCHPLDHHPDGGLSGTVQIPQFRAAREQRVGQRRGQGFAAAQNAQVCLARPLAGQQHLPGGRGGLHYRHIVAR